MKFSDRLRHFFHVVSNIRPIVWICLYVLLVPIFAVIYWVLPDGQFRIPDNAGTDFGSWLYYSIVTITTLGFGDYTPAHGWAQAVTAIEVMCGLLFLGFFLNAVGSMKSEIDVADEIERQRIRHESTEKGKLLRNAPSILHTLNTFLAYCYAVTTPSAKRGKEAGSYNPDFSFQDMASLFEPSGIPADNSGRPAVEGLIASASHTSLCLDSLQNRVDLSIWQTLLDNCFAFVADWQIFSANGFFSGHHSGEYEKSQKTLDYEKEISQLIASYNGQVEALANDKRLAPYYDLYRFIRQNAHTALQIESEISTVAAEKNTTE